MHLGEKNRCHFFRSARFNLNQSTINSKIHIIHFLRWPLQFPMHDTQSLYAQAASIRFLCHSFTCRAPAQSATISYGNSICSVCNRFKQLFLIYIYTLLRFLLVNYSPIQHTSLARRSITTLYIRGCLYIFEFILVIQIMPNASCVVIHFISLVSAAIVTMANEWVRVCVFHESDIQFQLMAVFCNARAPIDSAQPQLQWAIIRIITANSRDLFEFCGCCWYSD